MTKKIFYSMIAAVIAVLIVSIAITTNFLYGYFNKTQVVQLKDELSRIAPIVESEGIEYLENFKNSSFRFTVIEQNGKVIYDTVADVNQMENHLNRKEVKKALQTGKGSGSRYSDTMTQKTFYEAVLLKNQTILRVSVKQFSVLSLLIGMSPLIAAVVVVATILSLAFADKMAKKINERDRQEFTANVTHELKTPLQSIIGSAELLENGLVKEQDKDRFVGHIKNEAERLVNLINDIIRLSQLDEGKELIKESVDLFEEAKEVIEVLSNSAHKKDVTLSLEGTSTVIKGVKRYINEIIYNLCDNAIRYNNTGGSVKIKITKRGNNSVISISDTGIGIAPEYRERIFERFYRVDKSHSRSTGGTGLGLSIVKHAVQYHKGKIELESEVGKGTTVSVIF